MGNENLIKCVELIRKIQAGDVTITVVENSKLRFTSIDNNTAIASAIKAHLDVVTALATGRKGDDSYASVKRTRQTRPSCPQLLETGETLAECLYCQEWYPWLKDGKPTGLCLSRRASGDSGILNGGGQA